MGTVFDDEAGQADQMVILSNVTFIPQLIAPESPPPETLIQILGLRFSEMFRESISPKATVQAQFQNPLEMIVDRAH